MVTDEMNQQTKMQNPDNPAPVRTEAERKKWREEFFQERLKSVSAERIQQIASMIVTRPAGEWERLAKTATSGEAATANEQTRTMR